MKIAITSTGNDLNARVDPRFGRSPYFIIIDPDTQEFEAMENPNVQAMGGAGIQSAQLIANKGIEVLLTGSCGPNAFQTLGAAGVKVITGVSGTVAEAVSGFKSGQLKQVQAPNVGSHFGVGGGMGGGMGKGMGRGMGRGMGMGRGRMTGIGYGYGTGPTGNAPPGFQQPGVPSNQMDEKQELEFLKEQAKMLKEQIEEINKRMKELSDKE